jgi:hypothetical protein
MPRRNAQLEHSPKRGHIARTDGAVDRPDGVRQGVTMRRFGLLCLKLALPTLGLSACGYASSPFTGFGGFIGDTHTTSLNANRPVGDSENIRRVVGRTVEMAPLEAEPGNIWPGPPPPEPTLEDIERQQNAGVPLGGTLPSLPGQPGQTPQYPEQPAVPHPQPRPYGPPVTPRGSSTPPTAVGPAPQVPMASGPGPVPSFPAPQSPRTLLTPQGPAQISPPGGGVQTYSVPGGGTGIVVPNGNGTSTLVGPDGSVQTVPSAR